MTHTERRNWMDKIITMGWFLMDLNWMCQYSFLAVTFFCIALFATIVDTLLDKFSLASLATLFWLSANAMWMLHDLFAINMLLYAKFSALLGLLLVVVLVFKDGTIKLRLRRWN